MFEASVVMATGSRRVPSRVMIVDGRAVCLAGGVAPVLQVGATAAKDQSYVPGENRKAVVNISYIDTL